MQTEVLRPDGSASGVGRGWRTCCCVWFWGLKPADREYMVFGRSGGGVSRTSQDGALRRGSGRSEETPDDIRSDRHADAELPSIVFARL